MAEPLQKASEVTDYLLLPENLLQLAVIAGHRARLVDRRACCARGLPVPGARTTCAGGCGKPPGSRHVRSHPPNPGHGRRPDARAPGTGAFHRRGVQLTGLLLLIRVAVYLVRVSLGAPRAHQGWGTPISIVLWVFLSLHLLGWGQSVIAALDGIGISAGKTASRLVGDEAAGHREPVRRGGDVGLAVARTSVLKLDRPRAQHAHRDREVPAGVPGGTLRARGPECGGTRSHTLNVLTGAIASGSASACRASPRTSSAASCC